MPMNDKNLCTSALIDYSCSFYLFPKPFIWKLTYKQRASYIFRLKISTPSLTGWGHGIQTAVSTASATEDKFCEVLER